MTEKDKTISERVARYDERNAERGIIKVTVRIPEAMRERLLKLCAKWRREAGGE